MHFCLKKSLFGTASYQSPASTSGGLRPCRTSPTNHLLTHTPGTDSASVFVTKATQVASYNQPIQGTYVYCEKNRSVWASKVPPCTPCQEEGLKVSICTKFRSHSSYLKRKKRMEKKVRRRKKRKRKKTRKLLASASLSTHDNQHFYQCRKEIHK